MIAARLACVRAGALACALGLGACYGQAPPQRIANLRIIAEPATTTVYVDAEYFGSARVLAKHGKPVRAGQRLVTFMAPGYFPHDVQLDLAPGETTVRMKLLPIPK